MKKFLCWLQGHKNQISFFDADYQHRHDKCERCGVVLPIGYPYHKYYRNQDV